MLRKSCSSMADKAKISTVIESLACFADTGQFTALEDLYAPEVTVDLMALYPFEAQGPKAGIQCSCSLIESLALVLTGFDATRHTFRIQDIHFSGWYAHVHTDTVIAHYLQDDVWQVHGHSEFGLILDAGHWLVTHQAFSLVDVAGSPELLTRANNLTCALPDYLQRKHNEKLVSTYLDAMDDRDVSMLDQLWDEDGIEDVFVGQAGEKTRLVGKSDILTGVLLRRPADMHQFTSAPRFFAMQDAQLVFVEYTLTKVLDTRTQSQTMASLFHIDGDAILFHRQFSNSSFHSLKTAFYQTAI